MKLGFYYWLLVISLLPFHLSAQNQTNPSDVSPITQNIRGIIIDKDSKGPLFGAAIGLYRNSLLLGGTITDEKGEFTISGVPVGRHTAKVSYLGYRPFEIPDIVVTSGKEVFLSIELEESAVGLKDVVVIHRRKGEVINDMITLSGRTFTTEETKRYPGSRGDPARMASNYAGVRGADDSRNDIIVRGNSPLGLLWRLEGIEIPNPNHFALFGTTGGPVNILNNKTLSNSDFITSAFPAEYGDALAGVFDIKMRHGNNVKNEFTGQIGFLGVELMAEGPISKKKRSSYLISYRYSTLELFQLAGIRFGVSAVPKYQDLSFKTHFPTKRGYFSVFGVGGKSDIEMLDSERDTIDWSFGDAGKDVFFGSKMGVLGVTHMHFINENTYAKFSLSSTLNSSYSTQNLMRDTSDFRKLLSSSMSYFKNEFVETNIALSATVNKKFNYHHTVRTGLTINKIYFNLSDSIYNRSSKMLQSRTVFTGDTYKFRAFLQWKFKISERLTLNSGVHYLNFFYNNSWSLEPRIGIKWQFAKDQNMSMGYGYHSKIQPIYLYFRKFKLLNGEYAQLNKALDLTRSHHIVMAYNNSLNHQLHLKVEVYYQLIFAVPVDKDSATSFSLLNEGINFKFIDPDGKLTNEGEGTNYGIEATLEKFFTRKYFFLITASLYDSRYKGSDGIERNTNFNGNYTVNLLAGKEFNLNRGATIEIGVKTTIAGGNRYTPIDVSRSHFFEIKYLNSKAYSGQFNDYFRTDLKISCSKNNEKTHHELAIDLVNILNTSNTLTRTYNPFTKQGVDEQQLGFLPLFYYKISL